MKDENLTLGTYLRQEREKKNISLADIARTTKITLKNLEALERDEFHLLPPPVFVRGFLRAYAQQVGLDAQKILEMYTRQTEGVSSSFSAKKSEPPPKLPRLAKLLIPILLLILGIFLFYSLSSTPPSSTSSLPPPPPSTPVAPEIKTESPPAREEPPPQTTLPEEKKIEKPSLPSIVTAEKPPPSALEEKKKERRHVLKVRALEKCWLQIKADEEKEIEALLQPKEIATWTARRQFKIIIGNAGGVEVTFNGIRQGRLGESGQVVHLVLPPEIKKKISPAEGEKEVEKKD